MKVKSPIWQCEGCPVRKLTIVCDLKGEDLREFQSNVLKHKMKTGQLIYSEGDKCGGLYIIMHGRVKLYYESADGKEQIVDIIGPGAVFGDISLNADSKCDVSAECYEDGVYCSISLEYYQQLVQTKPQVAIRLLSVLETKLAMSRKIIRDLSLKRARQRMASVILRLAKEQGADAPEGMEIKLPINVQTLAYMCGLTQETASRVLSEFRKEKLLSLKARVLKVLNEEELTAIAETE